MKKFIAHGSVRGRRVTTHARCNVCILAGEFNTVYSCEPRFWKCHDENSPTLNLSFVSTSTADFFKHVNISYLQSEINIVSISRFEIKNKLIRKIGLWLSASTSKYWKYRYVFLRDDIFPVCRRYRYTFLSYVGRLSVYFYNLSGEISHLYSVSLVTDLKIHLRKL